MEDWCAVVNKDQGIGDTVADPPIRTRANRRRSVLVEVFLVFIVARNCVVRPSLFCLPLREAPPYL